MLNAMRPVGWRIIQLIGIGVSFVFCFAGWWAWNYRAYVGVVSSPAFYEPVGAVLLLMGGALLFYMLFCAHTRQKRVNTKHLNIATIILVTMLVTGLYLQYQWMRSIRTDVYDYPPELLDYNVSSLGEDMNVTHGSTLQVNVTLTSKANQELIITIDDFGLSSFFSESYDGELDTFIPVTFWPNTYLYNGSAQNEVFNYTLDTNQLVLHSFESNPIIITLEMADKAPLGEYIFGMSLENAQLTTHPVIYFTVTVT